MAETVGTLIDKLTIIEMRRWHLRELTDDPKIPFTTRIECAEKLEIVDEQTADLTMELSSLWKSILDGATPPKVYRQCKLYNDPRLRRTASGPSDD